MYQKLLGDVFVVLGTPRSRSSILFLGDKPPSGFRARYKVAPRDSLVAIYQDALSGYTS